MTQLQTTPKIDEKVDELRSLLGDIEMQVSVRYTIADAIREGSSVTEKEEGWGNGDTACALSAAYLAARARGFR